MFDLDPPFSDRLEKQALAFDWYLTNRCKCAKDFKCCEVETLEDYINMSREDCDY